jgi:formamidopyrimidine-DNA glycosylase
MPELPEVETVRRSLEQMIVGRTITGSTIGDFAGVIGGIDHQTFTSLIVGARIERVLRRAKYLFIETDGPVVIQVHLRMTGRIVVLPTSDPDIRFEHLRIHLDDGTDIRYGDQRKFGRVLLVDHDHVRALDRKLGPEPLSRAMTSARLHRALATRQGKIKNILLDQAIIAGLGNIYVDEALFRSRIHPLAAANTLTPAQCASLMRAIRAVLHSAIVNQGTTFSTFENPYGERGRNAERLLVYGKGGQEIPCPRCGTLLERLVVGGRGTTYCPECQRLPMVVGDSIDQEALQ